MQLWQSIALLAATITTGLMAGFFYAYSCSVMPGLRRADDRTLVITMRGINVAILNGWFFLVFIGSLILTVATLVLHLFAGGGAVLPWIVAALLLYGTALAVTARINVPLNNALDADGDPDRTADARAARERFETTWVRWNNVRTATSTAAFICLALAL